MQNRNPATIRQLLPADAGELFRLRQTALVEEPFAFISSPEDCIASSVAATRERLLSDSQTCIYGAFDGAVLIGMAGLTRDRHAKTAHRACIWGVFVDKHHRRLGLASRLLDSLIVHARKTQGVSLLYLSVSEKVPGARKLYESLGFECWGRESDCIRHDGQSAAEDHMTFSLCD